MTSLLLYAIYTNSFTFCEGGGLVSVKKVQRIIVYCCLLPYNCVLPFCREFFHALVCFTRSLRSFVQYFSTLEEKFRISARPCNILYLLQTVPTVSRLLQYKCKL